jgi:hypothetical protein
MTNEQVPVQAKNVADLSNLPRIQRILAVVFGVVFLCVPLCLTLCLLVYSAVSYEPVNGSIALVVLCISTFCSYRHTRKELKLRDTELRVRLDTPREGLAIVAGIVELPPQANSITCEITGRECVAYSFTMQEVKSSGEDVEQWEVFNESRSVPFVIRSQYGTVTVTEPVQPVPSTFACDSSYADIWFLERNQLTRRSLCTHNGRLQEDYAELMPGQHVTLLGKMSVDTEGGALLEDAEFSTQANPVFLAVSSAANLERLPGLLILGFVIPFIYLVWVLFTTG